MNEIFLKKKRNIQKFINIFFANVEGSEARVKQISTPSPQILNIEENPHLHHVKVGFSC